MIRKQCCGKDMEWVQFAWDIGRDAVMVSFGWWKCLVCHETVGSREDFSERYFQLPISKKQFVEA